MAKFVTAYLLREHSHSEPDVRYYLFDKVNFEQVQYDLDVHGNFTGEAEPMVMGSQRAEFTSTSKLVKFCDIFNIVIDEEVSCWMED